MISHRGEFVHPLCNALTVRLSGTMPKPCTSWREWVAGMQEKIAEWWQDTMPACIRQEVQNLEAIEGMIDELLQHCGQPLVTHWVTAQVADATESHPPCPTCGKPSRCVSRHRSLHKTGRFGDWLTINPLMSIRRLNPFSRCHASA